MTRSGPFIDSHVNLHHERFADDVADVVERAGAAGVVGMLTISDRRASTPAIARVADRYANVWRSVGVHPHYVKDDPGLDAQAIVALAAPADVVGIGECGLDFHYEHSPREIQFAAFRAHIAAARETGLPLIIHSRDADQATRELLEGEGGGGAFRPLLHCCTGGLDLARAVVAMGGYVSFAGILTFKNAEDVRAVARGIPLDRLLIETDCPYLAPAPHRGRRCEPAHVAIVAAALADQRGVSAAQIGQATTDNFFRLFARAKPEPGGLRRR
jgi:TatD DNase family protein